LLNSITVIRAVALFVASATAVIVMSYTPAAVGAQLILLPLRTQPEPSGAVNVKSVFCLVTVNIRVSSSRTLAVAGDMETFTCGLEGGMPGLPPDAVTDNVADAVFVVSASDLAVIVYVPAVVGVQTIFVLFLTQPAPDGAFNVKPPFSGTVVTVNVLCTLTCVLAVSGEINMLTDDDSRTVTVALEFIELFATALTVTV
jgi:hypothetical protein